MTLRSERLAAEIERRSEQLRAMKRELFTIRREESAERICCKCLKPIMVHHKWHYVAFEKATGIAHRHCNNPESYK